MIGKNGERGSEISVLAAQHDDDDDDPSFPYSNCFVNPFQYLYFLLGFKFLIQLVC